MSIFNTKTDRRGFLSIAARTGLALAASGSLIDLVGGCATMSFGKTSPNNSLVDKLHYVPAEQAEEMISQYKANPAKKPLKVVPSLFSSLGQENGFSRIAYELGKIPEFQDNVTPKEVDALEQIVELYKTDPKQFENVFRQMDAIGIKNVRKYDSPLQALFWLAEDGKLRKKDEGVDTGIIEKYTLGKLLYEAWNNNEIWETYFSEEEKKIIVDGVKTSYIGKIYQKMLKNCDESTVKTLLNDVRHHPAMFTPKAYQTIKGAEGRAKEKDQKWNDLTLIFDRLNAPVLVDFYINSNITYSFGRNLRYPESLIKHKIGDCDDVAYFFDVALSRAGYKTVARIVPIKNLHIGLAIEKNNKYWIVANFLRHGNTMSGPYNSISEVDHVLGHSNKINGSSHTFQHTAY
jgi:hypothetical protein